MGHLVHAGAVHRDVPRARELEPLLLELSLPYLTDEQMDRLEDLRVEIDAADDVSTFITLDREFHLASYAGHHEPFLHDTVERLWNNTQHYRGQVPGSGVTVGPSW